MREDTGEMKLPGDLIEPDTDVREIYSNIRQTGWYPPDGLLAHGKQMTQAFIIAAEEPVGTGSGRWVHQGYFVITEDNVGWIEHTWPKTK